MKKTINMKKPLILLATVGLAVSGLSACGAGSSVKAIDPSLPAVEGKFGEKPKIAAGEKDKEPKELKKAILVAGSGEECGANAVLRVNYTGQLWNGKVFDSSFEHGAPGKDQDTSIAFPLENTVKGWQEGLKDAKPGSRVELVIPPALGYGDKPMGEKIPANSTLVFVVDVLNCFRTKDTQKAIAGLKAATPTKNTLPGVTIKGNLGEKPDVSITDAKALPTKEEVLVLAEGKGAKIDPKDSIVYQISLKTNDDKEPLRSSWDMGKDKLNSDQVPPPLVGKTVGSRVIMFHPSEEKKPATVIVVDILGVVSAPKK